MSKLTRKERLNKAIDEVWESTIQPKLTEMAEDLAYDTSYSNGNREELIVDIDGNMTRHTVGQAISETWYDKIKECYAKVVAEIPYNWAEDIVLEEDQELEDIIDYRDIVIYPEEDDFGEYGDVIDEVEGEDKIYEWNRKTNILG